MKQQLIYSLLGFMFGTGLIIAGMTDPNKVINFLDITGHWDPSLAFVMIGALMVFGLGYHFIVKRMIKPYGQECFNLPTKTKPDVKLVIGSCLFGIGWGIAGICPGPAMVNLTLFDAKISGFIIMMLIGMKLTQLVNKRIS
ncbi:DUF6691 family protein [Algibacillus agarilyticus]|uniref:DUF6691 family protein n=1 Tax=Algibacillus agarilyticus TaxID=2234133 RepID=UPI000DD0B55C|nr:YeeE/YedE family protein [Algibacillus agarilyticus]